MNPRIMTFLSLVALGALAGLAAGCAESTPPPNDQWAAANEQVGRATATAPAVPEAKLHLQLAQEDMAKSKALIGEDNKRATTLIALATAEAQLATSLANAAQAQEAAQKAQGALQGTGSAPGASNLQAPNTPRPAGSVRAPASK